MTSRTKDVFDQAAGKAQKSQGESLATFLASLTMSGAILGLGLMVFFFLKWKCPEYYYQRVYHMSSSRWRPVPLYLRILLSSVPDPKLKYTSGLENYLLDRYLQTVLQIFILLGFVIIPVLLPINIINGRNEFGGVRGLDRLSYSNISLSHTRKYWFHLVLAIFAIIYVCYTIQKELANYSRLQRSLKSDKYKGSCLYIVSRSANQLSANAIKRRFHNINGGVYKVTIDRDFSSLRTKIRRRDALIKKLEAVETILIRKANHQRRFAPKMDHDDDNLPSPRWAQFLSYHDRPSIRLPLLSWLPALPLVGCRVDAIYYLRAEIERHNLEIEWHQLHPNEFPPINSASVHFNRVLSTSLAALALKARVPPTWTLNQEIMPNDIIWRNNSISWWQQYTQTYIVYCLVALLILGYAFPVTITGSLSQIGYLVDVVPWLEWIESLPSWLIAFIQGVLPPTILALITATVPVLIRLLANIQGHRSRQAVENYVQIYYYTFLFVQVFLAVSLSAGITTLVVDLKDEVTSTPVVLAQNLPKAYNYFFSYILINTFMTVVSTLIEVKRGLSIFVLSPLFDKTAREKWTRGHTLGSQNWGTFVPVLTNIACIGLIYSVIAPLILVFCIIYFGVLWLLYRSYPPKLTKVDLSSSFYPTAIRQLLTGVYFMELCLIGLFFLVHDEDDKPACIAQAIIMIFTTVLTALFHCILNHGQKLFMGTIEQPADKIDDEVLPERSLQDSYQDRVLTIARPILWIPKDKLGVADDEISQIKRTYNNILISNEGASLDINDKLRVWGDLPTLRDEDYD